MQQPSEWQNKPQEIDIMQLVMTSEYPLDRTEAEFHRLKLQNNILALDTDRFLRSILNFGDKVLEIGFGGGEVTEMMSKIVGEHNGKIVAIDNSPIAVSEANKKWMGRLPNVKFIEADAATYPPDSDLDVITGRLILMYLGEEAVKHFARITPEGSTIGFQEMLVKLGGDSRIKNSIEIWTFVRKFYKFMQLPIDLEITIPKILNDMKLSNVKYEIRPVHVASKEADINIAAWWMISSIGSMVPILRRKLDALKPTLEDPQESLSPEQKARLAKAIKDWEEQYSLWTERLDDPEHKYLHELEAQMKAVNVEEDGPIVAVQLVEITATKDKGWIDPLPLSKTQEA